MNEKEKKAIEELKSFKKDKDCKYWIGINGEKAIDIIIKLIEKQQKEIEARLKDEYLRKVWELQGFIQKAEVADQECISKDKIKELREIDNIDLIQFKLKELLGETND